MKRVINFSGGKTSAFMTILLEPTDDDIVLFTDTGREHPLTYKFIDDFEKIEGIKVHRAIYTNKNAPGLTGFDAFMKNRRSLPECNETGMHYGVKNKNSQKIFKKFRRYRL